MCVVDKTLTALKKRVLVLNGELQMIELFKAGKIAEARKLIVAKARTDEYNDIYTWLYRNLDLYTANDDLMMSVYWQSLMDL